MTDGRQIWTPSAVLHNNTGRDQCWPCEQMCVFLSQLWFCVNSVGTRGSGGGSLVRESHNPPSLSVAIESILFFCM